MTLSDPLEPEMVEIPPGIFEQGNDCRWVDGVHCRVVMIDYAFRVGKYPVTFAEYDRYLNAFREYAKRGRAESFPGLNNEWWPGSGDQGWERGRRPIINVNWHHAKSYTHWLCAMTGKAYRLLSEAEWEYGCRAGTETAYAFGETLSHSEAHFSERTRYRRPADRTIEVGAFPRNAFGAP